MGRPPRLCRCGAIVPHRTICACQREAIRARGRRHDARRPTAHKRGYDTRWRQLRAEFLRKHPCCAFCGDPAEVVDHIRRHRGNPALLYNWNNLQSLCKRCHDSVKQRQEHF